MPDTKTIKPTLTFSFGYKTDPALSKSEVIVGGRKYDLAKVGDKVRVTGPRDRKTCPICMRFVGNVYDADDPSIQMFREDGAHPRCRHILTPVGLPGLDAPIPEPGLAYVQDLINDGEETRLSQIYGQEKAAMLVTDEVSLGEIYRQDGTVKSLDELWEMVFMREDVTIPEGEPLPEEAEEGTLETEGRATRLRRRALLRLRRKRAKKKG